MVTSHCLPLQFFNHRAPIATVALLIIFSIHFLSSFLIIIVIAILFWNLINIFPCNNHMMQMTLNDEWNYICPYIEDVHKRISKEKWSRNARVDWAIANAHTEAQEWSCEVRGGRLKVQGCRHIGQVCCEAPSSAVRCCCWSQRAMQCSWNTWEQVPVATGHASPARWGGIRNKFVSKTKTWQTI